MKGRDDNALVRAEQKGHEPRELNWVGLWWLRSQPPTHDVDVDLTVEFESSMAATEIGQHVFGS